MKLFQQINCASCVGFEGMPVELTKVYDSLVTDFYKRYTYNLKKNLLLHSKLLKVVATNTHILRQSHQKYANK